MPLFQAIIERRNPPLALNGATVIAASLGLTLSSKIVVPFDPVPFTTQTLVVVGLGLALGRRRALVAVLLYLMQGAVGLPVFAETPEKGIGIDYMLGPTGGYLVGYLLAVLVAGSLGERGWRKPASAAAAALLASAVVYIPRLFWLGTVIGWFKPVLALGLYPFFLGDVVKAMLVVLLFTVTGRTFGSGRS
ncbi:biotin transporter BioY [Pseudaminobacter sp. NGMCC 1.201702]|uniref:biotin transporter BioY n=1 Tax=Pseudaminobacter sp. NGMCC 1.201702 TaxID=3391825 RepID=UPI0039EF965C